MNRQPVQKNAELELVIDSVTLEGAGVGRVDGFALFVPGALAGERVRVHIIKTTASYAVGKLLQVVEPTLHRHTNHSTNIVLLGKRNVIVGKVFPLIVPTCIGGLRDGIVALIATVANPERCSIAVSGTEVQTITKA